MSKINVPLGPQHPGLKEPINFGLVLEGEQVDKATVNLGYNHRGVEKAAEERTYIQDIYLIERVCGICSHSHTTCYITCVEEIAKAEIPERAKAIRVIVAELERVHSHLLWLGIAAYEIGFDTLFMYVWRDREHVLDCLELVAGNRVHYAINTLGGVRRDIDEGQRAKILSSLDALRQRTAYYANFGAQEPSFVARLAGVGFLSKEDAVNLCAVGPTTRASGVAIDVRKDDPYAVYDETPFEVCTADSCDVLGRAVVRIKELLQSYNIIEFLLKNLPDGPISVKAPRKAKPGEVVSRYEAPRGENIHYIKSNGTDKPERLKVRAPTLANYAATIKMLKNGFIADIPLIFAAIDPCICCAERAVELIDVRRGDSKTVLFSELRRMAGARPVNASQKRNAEWPL